MFALTITDLGHRWDRWVFRSFSDVFQDESVAITGPSGVGKTTMTAIIGGLIEPTEGDVVLSRDGERIVESSRMIRPHVAWVLQTTNAFANRSALANITSALELRGVDRVAARRRSAAALAAVGLTHRAEAKARHLSGGELQRLGVARALTLHAPLTIADEPTGQLDQQSSAEVADLLVSSRTPGGILIIVSHDADVAARCDRQIQLTSAG
jgi:ABC-type lipoprotein export system ATPase subunit